MADAYFEADGVAIGNPKIKAGCKVKVEGVGTKFGGEFTISSSTHSYHGHRGYQTQFQISGRSARTLTELVRPPADRGLDRLDRGRRGDQQQRPRQRGRVRVKYPSLSDKEESRGRPSPRPAPATRAVC